MKTPVRRTIAAVALLFAAPAVTACAQGFGAQTDQVYQPVDGVSAQMKGADVIAATVVAGEDHQGTLSAGLVADKADSLTQVTGDGVSVTGLPIKIKGNQPLNLSERGVVVAGDAVEPGNYIELTFTFASGEAAKLSVPVVAQSGDYAKVPLPKSTPATPSPSTPATSGTQQEGTSGSTGSTDTTP